MLDIKITRTTSPKEKPDENNLGFGKKFTDHMFVMDYTEGKGWHDARIVPYGPFELDPATVVFHYAQEIFEGMKAYRTADDTVQLFRPDCNAKRFQDSADRLCIPKIPVEDYIQAVETLVDVDRDWVPHSDGASLYIRPFIFANDVGLGVHASKHYIFCIICAPSGAYYAEGINPVRIYVEDEYIRAAPGLTGFTKCGGNYAASIKAGELAEEQGYAQVLWLDGVEKKYVEEVGSMNIMFKIDGKVYTAATVGTVLPGVTRRSCIELLKDWGYEVVEGKIAIADIMAAAREGKLEEVFGTGTAAVVSPVKELVWKGEHALHRRRQDRPCHPEAVRHHDRDAVGQDPRHQGLDRSGREEVLISSILHSEFSKRRQASARRRLLYHGGSPSVKFPKLSGAIAFFPAQC